MKFFATPRRLISFVLVAGLALASLNAQSASVSESMRQMAGAYGTAMKSEDINAFTQAIQKLSQAVDEAGKIKFSVDATEQKQYDEGLASLKQDLEKVKQAIAQNDLPAAKQAMGALDSDKKKYHGLLIKK